jgi:hypothetical protein
VAVPLGVTGLGLLGWLPTGASGFWRRDQKSGGQASQVRSNFLAVELDHDTGAMSGEIIAGRLAGTKLDQLELSTLVGRRSRIGQAELLSKAPLLALTASIALRAMKEARAADLAPVVTELQASAARSPRAIVRWRTPRDRRMGGWHGGPIARAMLARPQLLSFGA